ncbi:hypothetical protein C8R43DRAFT_986762 [Mycena crocata]|nr:hypothetical protein C8R43DRAFT_986762 [Mycena crocata]
MTVFNLLLLLCGGRPDSTTPVAASSPEPALDAVPSKIPKYLKTLKSGLVLLLAKTEPFLAGTPFKIPISVVNSFIDLATVVSDNNQALKDLFLDITQNVSDVNDALERATSAEAKDRVQKLSELLQQEMNRLDVLLKRGTPRKILESDDDTKTIEATVKRIDGHLNKFHRDTILALEGEVNRLKVDSALSILYQAAANDAAHDSGERFSPPRCHAETRTEMLANLRDWCSTDDTSTGVCWLHAPAGAGKSAIAQSLCEVLESDGRLGGSFFFKRGDPSRGRGMKLFPTIAYQLTRVSPELKHVIGTRVGSDPAIVDESPSAQLEKLVIEPTREITVTPSRVLMIIIDGLDECEGEELQQELLRSIGHAVQSQAPLRFLIASRPEPHIEKIFRDEPALKGRYDVNVEQSFDDVRKYLLDEFEWIRGAHKSMVSVLSPWPAEEVVDYLVDKSSGYFIYAATVVKFVDNKDFNPKESLAIVMGREEPGVESPLAPLDQLYTQILNTVPLRARPRLLRILSVIAAQLNLSPAKIGQLLQLDPGDIDLTLRRLHSVIAVPSESHDEHNSKHDEHDSDDEGENHGATGIAVHHASFLDFLMSSSRSTKFHFSDLQRQNLACDMVRAFSDKTPNGRIVSAIDHVAWPLDLEFLTSTQLSPNLIGQLPGVNLDFIFYLRGNGSDAPRRTADTILDWLKAQQSPEDLIQQWEDYHLMAVFDNICAEAAREARDNEKEMQGILRVFETSPQLTRIIHAYRLLITGNFFATLFEIRLALDYSWEELRLAICPLREMIQEDEKALKQLVTSVSHPTNVRELYPDRTLENMAKHCLRCIKSNIHLLPNESRAPGDWSTILRSCPASSDLLNELRQISRAQITSRTFTVKLELYNITQWLETFADRPVDLITRFQYDPWDKKDPLNRRNPWEPDLKETADFIVHSFDRWKEQTGWR